MFNDQQITTAYHTVTHLAVYLQELKASDTELHQTVSARERGYFTPSEEEQVRAMFISYLRTRAALLDLVISIHEDIAGENDRQDEAFLIGFAGAVLLVDAASFLVKSYANSDTIKRKLNEADPVNRIEPGAYDAINQSLTDPLNVWRLYQARHYFDDNESQLRSAAQGRGWNAVVQIIDDLGHCVQFTAVQYAEARMRVRADQVVSVMTRLAVHKLLYGLQEMLSRMASGMTTSPGHRPKLPSDIYLQLAQLLKPGDVLVTRKEHALTNYFLPGYWPHAALYVGEPEELARRGFDQYENVKPHWSYLCSLDDQEPRRVLEALKDGVRTRSLNCPLSSDSVAVIRPRLDESDIFPAMARGFAHEGKPYDFDFMARN